MRNTPFYLKNSIVFLICIIILLLILLILKNCRHPKTHKTEGYINDINEPILAIHSVFILPENFIFLEEWIVYHIELGFSQFYLYDNYGSVGRDGSSKNKTRMGLEFNKMFDINKIYKNFEDLKNKYHQITYIKWQPKNQNNEIIYEPGKAIAHYRDNFSNKSSWTAFIDPDEFIILNDTNSTNIKDYIKEKENNNFTKLLMKQKKFQDRFCNINKYIFDIDNTIINVNVDGWAYKCLYKNIELDKDESNFFMHDIKMKNTGKTHLCELNELRFNHYNVNNTQINWMKGFLKKDIFEHGKDNSMNKFKYLIEKYNIPKHSYNIEYFNSVKNDICYNFKENFTNNDRKDLIYISLTTIPDRLLTDKFKKNIDSLVNQNKNINILLNIPHYSTRFKKQYIIPEFLNDKKYNKIQIIRCHDYGPATKLLGCLDYIDNKYKNTNNNIYILILDADREYNNNLLDMFIKEKEKHPNNIIAATLNNDNLNVKIPYGCDGIFIPYKLINTKEIKKYFKKHEKNCRYVDDVLWYKYFIAHKKFQIIELADSTKTNLDLSGLSSLTS